MPSRSCVPWSLAGLQVARPLLASGEFVRRTDPLVRVHCLDLYPFGQYRRAKNLLYNLCRQTATLPKPGGGQMRLSLILGICAVFLFTLHTDISFAQTTNPGTGYNAPKSERACYKCCRRWQARMGWSPSRLDVCAQKCMIGTGRNC